MTYYHKPGEINNKYHMTRKERKELDELSTKVYGKPSKWHKMVNKPEIVDVERTLENGTKQKYRTTSYYSLEEVKKIMNQIWQEELERKAKEKTKENEITFEDSGVIGTLK